MNLNPQTDSTNDQIQLLQNQLKTSEVEKIQLKNEIYKLKESLTQMESIREKAALNESELISLQQTNFALTQQINNLKENNAQLIQQLSQNSNKQKNFVSPVGNEIELKTKENKILQSEISQLNQKIKSMDERHQIELTMRDDLIIKLKESNSKNSKKKTSFELDYEHLEQKYIKKKSELILFKQRFEEELKSNEESLQIANNECNDIKKKFHLLKKKYVDQKNELTALKTTNEKLVKQLESMSFDLQRMNAQFIPNMNEFYQYNRPISYVQRSDDIQELKQRAEKAENELVELRCLLKVMANDEQQPQRNANNLYDQLDELSKKIDNLKKECSDIQPKSQKVKNNPMKNRNAKLPQWRRFQDY